MVLKSYLICSYVYIPCPLGTPLLGLSCGQMILKMAKAPPMPPECGPFLKEIKGHVLPKAMFVGTSVFSTVAPQARGSEQKTGVP